MRRDIRMHLLDISQSIDSIFEYLDGVYTIEAYDSNKLIRRAVERELEIIGEATNRIVKNDPNIDISDARRIVNLRNWVIHSYDNIDNVLIWGVIKKDLPLLKSQVVRLLEEIDS